MKIKSRIFALSLFILSAVCAANAQTQTLSLVNGDSLTPASGFVDPSGVRVFYGGFVNGQVVAASPATFTFSVAFRESALINAEEGIYSGTIIAPNSSFAVTTTSGRKSTTTSGTINSGTVTYRLTADNRADLISIVSTDLTIWEGQNKRRIAVGTGTLD